MYNKYLQDERNHIFSGTIVFNALKTENDVTHLGIDENGFLVKTNSGSSGGVVESVTGDGVGGTAENPVLSYPTPEDIGAIAEGNILPSDFGYVETNTNRIVTTDSTTGATWELSVTMSTGIQPSTVARRYTDGRLRVGDAVASEDAVALGQMNAALATKVSSQQEGGVGTVVTNIIQVTQAEYDGLTPQAGTFYAIVG